jgi:hypothetical protein
MVGVMVIVVVGAGCASGESAQGYVGPQDGGTTPIDGPVSGDGGVLADQAVSEDGSANDVAMAADALPEDDATDSGNDAACSSGYVLCSDACVPYPTAANCGRCGNVCSGQTPVCAGVAGAYSCVSGCPSVAPTICEGACVDTTSDANNCGGCGPTFACVSGATCSAGHCSGGTPEAGSDSGNLCPADPVFSGACPSACTGGCVSNTCIISCVTDSACKGTTIYCPSQLACQIQCAGNASCQDATVYCSSSASCAFTCSGVDSCQGSTLYCNSKACEATCTGPSASLRARYCMGSCNCTTNGC